MGAVMPPGVQYLPAGHGGMGVCLFFFFL